MALAFLPGGFGIGEIGLIVLIIVLLFGARRIPELARALGKSLSEFKRGQRENAGSDLKQEKDEVKAHPDSERRL